MRNRFSSRPFGDVLGATTSKNGRGAEAQSLSAYVDGVSVIDGHVQGRFELAIFYRLKDLKIGEAITVEYGDGRRIHFTIMKVAQYDADETSLRLFEKLPSIDKQLVLVTCGGTFDKSSQTYDQRFVVYAQKI